jgi:hypothetical protein
MLLSHACRRSAHDTIVTCQQRCVLAQTVRQVVSGLRLQRRGRRAGVHNCRLRLAVKSVTSSVNSAPHAGEVPVVIGNRRYDVNGNQLFHGCRDIRSPVISSFQRRSRSASLRVGLFNARSVSDKSASIQQWICDMHLGIAALVET